MNRAMLSALVVCALSGSAMAAFVVNAAGPVASAGPVGDAGNGIVNATYLGSNDVLGMLTYDGDLTEVLTATFASEARWRMTNATLGGFIDYQPTTTTSFTGTIHVNRSSNVLTWANTNDNFTFQAFESLNDGAGTDANWTNVVFNFAPSVVITDLGDLAVGSHNFDTFTSSFDTELGLYSSAGSLIASNDDSGGLQSLITQNLGVGDYHLVLGGFNTIFATGFATPGTANGNYNLQIDGVNVDSGALANGAFRVYSFHVPEPATIGLLALGGLLIRRRRA
jgi:hypothetical protein